MDAQPSERKFLAHKHQLTTHAFCMPTTMCARARSTSLPACRRYPKSLLARLLRAILLAIRFYRPGVLKRVCSIPNSRRRENHDIFLRMVVGVYEPWKVRKRRRKFTYQPRRDVDTFAGVLSGYFSIFIVLTKINSIAPAKIPAFTLYQIRQ